MKKKGAVELSMTTIIIIVIGITVLSLGLVWIRGTFEDITRTTRGASEQADSELAEIFGGTDQAVALSPSEISVEQGGEGSASLAVNNLGSTSATVTGTVEAIRAGSGSAENLNCYFSYSLTGDLGTETIGSGQGLSNLIIYVDDYGSDLGTYGCAIDLDGDIDEEITLIVKIE
tara:strand:+ start:519 stop:1040 length:522 start_codon:yes stop_codon:yes gene_type:complete